MFSTLSRLLTSGRRFGHCGPCNRRLARNERHWIPAFAGMTEMVE